jgi:hypothetical protein
MGRRKLTAGKFIAVDRRVGATEAKARLQERDARIAADDRTEVERFLGDPPRDRSALAQGRDVPASRRDANGIHVDLWKR